MSAAVLLSVVAPSAPAKGAKADARAVSDAEAFGAALEEAAQAEAAPEPALSTKAETASQPAVGPAAAPETDVSASDAATPPLTFAAAHLPPTVPAEPLLAASAASETKVAAVAPGPSPAPDEGVSPAPAPSDDAEVVDPSLAQPTRQSRPTETAPCETPVASDLGREVVGVRPGGITSLRPAKPPEPSTADPTAEAVPVDGAEADAASDAPAVAAITTPPAGTTRVRDVIDRALGRPSAQGAGAADPQRADIKVYAATPSTTATATATTPSAAEPSIAKSPIEVPAAVPPPASSDEAPPLPLSSAPTAREAPAAETASTPVLSTVSRAAVETTAQIAAQIVRKLEGRSTRFEMALTPEDLGRVDVSLDIDADGALHATLAFDNPVAATELRGRADELRRQLTEAGFTVGDDALSFAERDPSAGQGGAFGRDADPRTARAFGAASRLTAEADLSLQAPAWISLSLTPAGVDMKV